MWCWPLSLWQLCFCRADNRYLQNGSKFPGSLCFRFCEDEYIHGPVRERKVYAGMDSLLLGLVAGLYAYDGNVCGKDFQRADHTECGVGTTDMGSLGCCVSFMIFGGYSLFLQETGRVILHPFCRVKGRAPPLWRFCRLCPCRSL